MGTLRFGRVFLIRILILILSCLVTVSVETPNYKCGDSSSNYTSQSEYRANIDTLLNSLISISKNDTELINNNGFSNLSFGEEPNRANGIAMCRGDLSVSDCRNCYNESAHEITQLCSTQKEAIVWYGGCMLRYSNRSIFGTAEDLPAFWYYNVNNASDVDQFYDALGTLLGNLRDKAANGNSTLKFAANQTSDGNFRTIYGLVQCTPDLSSMDCYNCIGRAINGIPENLPSKVGGGVTGPSCNLRFDEYVFFNQPSPPSLTTTIGPSSLTIPLQSPPISSSNGGDRTRRKIGIIAAIAASVLALFLVLLYLLKSRRKAVKKLEDSDTFHSSEDQVSIIESLHYEFGAILVATDNFSEANKLGRGGFGTVYKGVLATGEEVAVKRLEKNSGQGDLEFKTEVGLVAKLQHRNLVRLLGFCLAGEERLLIYEMVQNGSLDHFLFDPNRHVIFDWRTRLKIILGIARGIVYLHEDSRLKVIHRDLKAGNILLDDELSPKIADFGTARLFQPDQTHCDTERIAGTYGYMAPEYALYGLCSVKADVYSFGVLLLEILSGRRINGSRDEVGEDLITNVWRHWRDGSVSEVVDPDLRGGRNGSRIQILRCIHVGLLCVQEEALKRPTMSSVVLMLTSQSISLPVPSRSAYVGATRSQRW